MRLCFGSLLAVLIQGKSVNVDNKKLCEALLQSASPNYQFIYGGKENPNKAKDDVSSKLLRCVINVPKDVVSITREGNFIEIVKRFEENVSHLIDGSKRKHIILAIKDIIANDHIVKEGKKTYGIDDDTEIDVIGKVKKRELATRCDFHFNSFVAGVLIFAIVGTENRSGKKCIKAVKDNDQYILSFSDYTSEINLLADTANDATLFASQIADVPTTATVEDVANLIADKVAAIPRTQKSDNDLLVTLLSQAKGKCLECGDELGIPIRGNRPIANCKIVYVTFKNEDVENFDNAVALCESKCAELVAKMTSEAKTTLLERKRNGAANQAFIESVSDIKFQKEIETVLRSIHQTTLNGEMEPTDTKDLVEIEQKIKEPYLRVRIDSSMVLLYKAVKNICSQLEQEIGFDTKVFGEMMKAAQTILSSKVSGDSAIKDPQSRVVKLLVEKLSAQVGQQHSEACEIVIGYLVKRCDLFNENAK